MASQHELTAKLKQMLTIGVAILTMTIFYGCDGGSSSPTVYSGMLIDSPVEGVEYSTPTQSGITDSQGTFKYQAGEMVTFYVGGFILGNPKVRMLSVLLI